MATKYIVEHHTGRVEDYIGPDGDSKPDHQSIYDDARAAINAIGNIMWNSARNHEHRSPIICLRCEEE